MPDKLMRSKDNLTKEHTTKRHSSPAKRLLQLCLSALLCFALIPLGTSAAYALDDVEEAVTDSTPALVDEITAGDTTVFEETETSVLSDAPTKETEDFEDTPIVPLANSADDFVYEIKTDNYGYGVYITGLKEPLREVSVPGVIGGQNVVSIWLGNLKLVKLDVSACTRLVNLICYENDLTSLNVTNNRDLKSLLCDENQLTSLDVSKNPALETLWCDENQLTSLDVSKNLSLRNLCCSYNQLTVLSIEKNTRLRQLYCPYNKLSSLDTSKHVFLGFLDCSYNQLTTLDICKNTTFMEVLFCNDNQLVALDIGKNPNLYNLECYNNYLSRVSELVSWLATSGHEGQVLPQKLAIATTSFPVAIVGKPYTQKLTALGIAPIALSISSGSLPKGLRLSGDGTISGTPTTLGTATFVIKASNVSGTTTKALSIKVAEEDANSNLSAIYTLGISKKTLGIQKKSTKTKAYVELQSTNYGPTQRFRLERVETASKSTDKDYYTITNVLSGKRLEVKGGKLSKGTLIWQNKANTSKAQRFSVEKNPQGGYWLSPKGSNLVLALKAGKTKPGTRIVLATKSSTAKTQSFSLGSTAPALNNGTYALTGVASKKNMEAKSLKAKSPLQLNKANKKSKKQKFKLVYDQKTGYYTIKTTSKKLVLDIKDGAVVLAKPKAKSYSQKWFVKKNKNGSITLINAKTGKALEPKGKVKKNKTPLVVSKPKNVKAQQWKAKTA